ncbi:hypothetical protein AD936_22770, partial [Gluconobacter japonicus]
HPTPGQYGVRPQAEALLSGLRNVGCVIADAAYDADHYAPSQLMIGCNTSQGAPDISVPAQKGAFPVISDEQKAA